MQPCWPLGGSLAYADPAVHAASCRAGDHCRSGGRWPRSPRIRQRLGGMQRTTGPLGFMNRRLPRKRRHSSSGQITPQVGRGDPARPPCPALRPHLPNNPDRTGRDQKDDGTSGLAESDRIGDPTDELAPRSRVARRFESEIADMGRESRPPAVPRSIVRRQVASNAVRSLLGASLPPSPSAVERPLPRCA